MTTGGIRFRPILLILSLAWMGTLGALVADESELQEWIGRFYQEIGISESECPPEFAGGGEETTRLVCGHTELKFPKFRLHWQNAADRFAAEGITVPSAPPSWQQRGRDHSRLYLSTLVIFRDFLSNNRLFFGNMSVEGITFF